MTSLADLLAGLRAAAVTEREKGTDFEELILAYLRNEASYTNGKKLTDAQYRVEKMRYGKNDGAKDLTTIHYNEFITVRTSPPTPTTTSSTAVRPSTGSSNVRASAPTRTAASSTMPTTGRSRPCRTPDIRWSYCCA